MKRLIAAATLLAIMPALALAQNADHQYRGQGYAFFGLGTPTSTGHRFYHPAVEHIGFGGEGFLVKGFGIGVEVGWAYWGGGVEGQAWTASGDVSYHFRRSAPRGRVDPFVLVGITGYFPTSHGARGAPAGNFGGGVNIWLRERAALRLEVRDHVSDNGRFGPGNHYLSLRVGVTFR
jgi:hypothetical protein